MPTEPDVREVSMLLKQVHDISVAAPPPLRPFTFPEAELESSSRGRNVRLQSVRILENVNAIKQGQELSFDPNGLTVIFGENGSGKSGYARVIQRACNIGHIGDKIISSIYASHGTLKPASVFFKFNEEKYNKKWEDDKGEQISGPSIAFYDSKIASIVIDRDNDVVFRPNELILLESLRESCDDIETFIKKESADIRKKLNESSLGKIEGSDIEGSDIVSNVKMVLGNAFHSAAEYYKDIDDEKIDQMAIYSEDELNHIKNTLKFGSVNEIMREVDKLRKHRENILRVENLINELAKQLNEIATNLPLMLIALKEARDAAEISRQIFNQKHLPGTGGELWKQLFEAAKMFSDRSAYPDEEFPVVRAQARCVLCQQNLANDGIEAMKQFGKYIRDNTAKVLDERNESIGKIREKLIAISAQLKNVSEHKSYVSVESIPEWSDGKFSDMSEKIKTYCDALSKQSESLIAATFSKVEKLPDLPEDPAKSIKMACEWISNKNDVYNKRISQQKPDEEKYRDLTARQALTHNIDSFKLLVKLNRCICEIKKYKTPITQAVDKIYEGSHGQRLQDNLNAELEFLGKLMDGRDVRFRLHGGGGHPKIQMIIKGATINIKSSRIPLSRILSEGEHNCVALASFLAQAFVPEGPATLVFDDPASSVDADRIEIIADRLREVAQHKQVIVFTHDVSFARLLCEGDIRKHGIWKHGQERGIVDEIPFAAMGCADQVKTLERSIEELEDQQSQDSDKSEASPSQMQESIEACYRRLRMAIEAFVEEKVLGKVITRKKPHLLVSALGKVYVNSERKSEIAKSLRHLYKRVSERMHKREIAAVLSLPELKEHLIELRSYLDEFESIRDSVNKPLSLNADGEATVVIQDDNNFPSQNECNN